MPTFKASLKHAGPGDAWTYLEIPFDAVKAFGSRGRVSVEGTIGGFPFRSSIFPNGSGGHHMMVNKAMQAGGRLKGGKPFVVTMEKAGVPPPLELPGELATLLAGNETARTLFDAMTYACRREYADYIAEAKQPATRVRRAEKSLALILQRRRVKA